jgi:hypothetical protein
MIRLPKSWAEAFLANVNEFTVSCRVLNLIPVVAFVTNVRQQNVREPV